MVDFKTDRVTVEHSGAVDASGGGVHADKRLAQYFGVAVCGAKKKVNKLTGSLPLLR